MSGEENWQALVLAASRGADDPIAKAFGLAHKCLLPLNGKPMLSYVLESLSQHPAIGKITIIIEDETLITPIIANIKADINTIAPADTAAASVRNFLQTNSHYPLLITTGDHPLLDRAMLDDFLTHSTNVHQSGADITVGLATKSAINKRFPDAKRTFLSFGKDYVSGCNLFGVLSGNGIAAAEFWQHIEKNRKKPLKLVAAFGPWALLRFITGFIGLESAFALASKRICAIAKPVLMANPEAAVDVDKPEHKKMAEDILQSRS